MKEALHSHRLRNVYEASAEAGSITASTGLPWEETVGTRVAWCYLFSALRSR